MSQLRILVRRHPLASALALYLAFEAAHVALAWDGGQLLRGVPAAWRGPVAWGTYGLLALVPVLALRWWRETGLTRLGRREALPYLAPPLLAGAAFFGVGIHLDPADLVPLIIVGTPLIALNEELFFRGVLLEVLRPLGWHRAIVISAVLFGVAHAVNLLSGGYPPFIALQVAATTAGGVAFAAIRIRSGSLWPLIVLHVALDAIALSTMTGDGVSSPFLLPVVFAWGALNALLWPYGWRLLRGRADGELDRQYDGESVPEGVQPAARQASPT